MSLSAKKTLYDSIRGLGFAGLLLVVSAALTVGQSTSNLQITRAALLRYNRVEGLFVGYGIHVKPTGSNTVTGRASGGYGIHNQERRWDFGLKVDKPKWSADAGIFDRTASPNESIIRTAENTVFAFLFKGDYLDYFRMKNGFEVDVRLKPRRHVSVIGYLSAFQYQNMPVDASWTVFRSNHTFRQNPAIREGDAAVFKTGVVYNNRRKSPIFRNATFVSAIFERGFREFPFNGIALSFKRHQKTIFGRQALVARTFLGSRESIDEQHQFDIGGVGTLRGYRTKEYSGNRTLQFNVDYLFRGDIISRISGKLGQYVELIAFADAGWVGRAAKQDALLDGFGSIQADDIKTNLGAAISMYRQLIRINVARRFDNDIDDWTVSARFRREF
jgi:hypothetical protein